MCWLCLCLYWPFSLFLVQAQRRARIHKLRLDEGARKAAEELEKCTPTILEKKLWIINNHMVLHFVGNMLFSKFYADDPHKDPNITGDPYKTLFVARLVSHWFFICFISFSFYNNAIFIGDEQCHWLFWEPCAELRDYWAQDQKGVWSLWANQTGKCTRAIPMEAEVIDLG